MQIFTINIKLINYHTFNKFHYESYKITKPCKTKSLPAH